MSEPGRTNLQMMLVQQSGPGALPLSILSPNSFLPFLRNIEQIAIDERLAPVIVYWSRHTAARLLPGGQRYRELIRDAFCVSIFSEERADPPDEWCFLIESRGLCLIVYGQQAMEQPEADKFQCAGSMDPQIVRQAFNRLLPMWQGVDVSESDRLEDARVNLGPCGSAAPYLQPVRAAWPVIKAPIQQNLILQPTDGGDGGAHHNDMVTMFSDRDKVPPIAIDPSGDSSFKFGASFKPSASTHASPMGRSTITKMPAIPLGMPVQDIPGEEFDQSAPAASDSGGMRRARAFSDEHEELSPVPPAAQAIIQDIVGQLRHSNDLASILQFAIEALTLVCEAERGLIWQVEGDQLAVTNEFSQSGHTCFVGNQLHSQESTAIVLEFLSRFPDESGAGVISVPDTAQDTKLHKMSPTLSSLMELGDVRGRLMVQLRSRGIFSGFLEVQQCGSPRQWSRLDAMNLQAVAEMLSVVVQQSFDQSKIEMDAKEMKLINEIASLFRESRGKASQDSLVKSVMLVAEHMGFTHSQIYLFDEEDRLLVPQIDDGGKPVELTVKEDPFVAVFESGRGKIVNAEFSRKADPFFGHDMALVLPLISKGDRLGVIGLWQRLPNKPQFRPQDRELGLTIAGHLSDVIRAEQFNQQIRADQARSTLINKVSSEIRQSLKEADQIMETLATCIQDYFELNLSMVAQYDGNKESFVKWKAVDENGAPLAPEDDKLPEKRDFVDQLFSQTMSQLKEGKTIFLKAEDMKELLEKSEDNKFVVPDDYSSATLVPLVHAGNLKAALCMVSPTRARPFSEKDMTMVADLADRVAVVISHAELYAQKEQQAVTDPMTGLFNRRYFQEQLTKEIDRFQRFGHAFSFIIVDLDFLKKINDSLGHHHGDAAIKHIANVLKRNVRDVDTVGRFGGEEFVVLLPETDLKNARMVAERICRAIREKPIETVGVVTASLGLAAFPQDAQDKERLFELVDQALYLAKHRGRNQVCSVSEDLMPTLSTGVPIAEQAAAEKAANQASAKRNKEEPPVTAAPVAAPTGPSLDLALVNEKGILGVFAQIMKAIEQRDGYGPDRSPRAYGYANKVAQACHISKEETEIISLAAVLSNLGKLGVPENVLKKEGPLDETEMDLIRKAPTSGAKLLEPAKLLYRVSQLIEAYHENWDGSGYPKGLKDNAIPPGARIIAIVDAYTAMTSERPYRKALTKEEALKVLQEEAGKKFDPRLVKIFVSLIQKDDKLPEMQQ